MSVFSDGPDGSSGKKGFSSSRGGALAIEAIDLRRRKCSDCRGRLMRGRRVCKRAAMTGKELGAVLNLYNVGGSRGGGLDLAMTSLRRRRGTNARRPT
jgi:hypothetical protein